MNVIRVGNRDFNYEIIYKRGNKNIYLRIKDNKLIFTTPRPLGDDFIKSMILKNFNQIIKALDKSPPLSKNTIHLFGVSYKLQIIQSNLNVVRIVDDTFYIHTTKNDTNHIQKIVTSFYASKLEEFVELNQQHIKNKFHIEFDIEYDYKNVSSYFGECFPNRHKIILATKLCKYDKYYILSVIYHEFAHFFYKNHGTEFYMLLEKLFPNYYKTQSILRKIKYNDAF